MCMKYVNANIICYHDVISDGINPVEFKNPFDVVTAVNENGIPHLKSLKIVTHINILGTEDDNEKETHVLYNEGKLNCEIKLTKCATNVEDRQSIKLDEFTVDSKKLHIDDACYPFLNHTYFLEIDDIPLQFGVGKYVIKLLVNNPKINTDFTVQTMRMLVIKDRLD